MCACEGRGVGRGFFPCPKWNSSLVFNVKFYDGKFHSQGKKNFDSSYCGRFPSWGSEKNALETVQNCTVPTIVFFILRAEKIRRRAPDLSAFLTVHFYRYRYRFFSANHGVVRTRGYRKGRTISIQVLRVNG